MDIRENENGTVTVNGLEIDGFVAEEKSCPYCSESPTIYFDAFDSYACPRCDRWAEQPCRDPGCAYCRNRPEAPFPDRSAPGSSVERAAPSGGVSPISDPERESY